MKNLLDFIVLIHPENSSYLRQRDKIFKHAYIVGKTKPRNY